MRRLRRLSARGLGARLPIAYKIMVPFLALTLLSGLTFATVAAVELASGATAQSDAALLRQDGAVSERMASFSAGQLLALRLLSRVGGLADSVEAADRDGLQALLFPMLSGDANLLNMRISIVSPGGIELLTLRMDPSDPQRCYCTYGRQLAA